MSDGVRYGDIDAARRGEILRTLVGSGVHGIAIEGTDDRDEMGIFVEPVDHIIGIRPAIETVVFRTQPEGVRSGPGDLDLVYYGLQKYLRLAAKGNPTALLPLWCADADVLDATTEGWELRGIRAAFMSRQAVRRFLGYLTAQHTRMMASVQRNVPNRPELVERFGYDVKYAAHALRLAYEGLEIAYNGTLTLPLVPRLRDTVLSVKRGEWAKEIVSHEILARVRDIETELPKSPLPEDPDWDRINSFCVDTYKRRL